MSIRHPRRNNINSIERRLRSRIIPYLQHEEPNRDLATSNIHRIEGLIREIRLFTTVNDPEDNVNIEHLLDELRILRETIYNRIRMRRSRSNHHNRGTHNVNNQIIERNME